MASDVGPPRPLMNLPVIGLTAEPAHLITVAATSMELRHAHRTSLTVRSRFTGLGVERQAIDPPTIK
jgi:hypothetical protein